jgi:hypothetical protein
LGRCLQTRLNGRMAHDRSSVWRSAAGAIQAAAHSLAQRPGNICR